MKSEAETRYKPTIGLEIHVELKTQTKMFCRSKNDANETLPNVNVCPVCMAHPGTLPVINRAAVMYVLRVGAALGGRLADYTEFDRKNYFYPDLPKGYQISQFEFPLISGGELASVAITRVHLEEDTASSVHSEDSGETFIDFNRAGVPLMELVTEPVIHSAEEAGRFARELQLLLRYLDVSDADMEKGLMRVEANISISKDETLGTKVEVKNLNSFRAMERAVEYEIRRQTKLLEKGEKVAQETRGWDEGKQSTFAQRTKEGSADYRYFPDPDLPSFLLSDIEECSLQKIANDLPELPEARRARYRALGIREEDVVSFVRDSSLGVFFENVISEFHGNSELTVLAANYIANDLVKHLRDMEEVGARARTIPIEPMHFQKLISLVAAKKISSRGAKDILAQMVQENRDPETIARERGYVQSGYTDVEKVVQEVIAANAAAADQFRAGKANALEFLLGQAMKAMRGTGNPAELRAMIVEKLSN